MKKIVAGISLAILLAACSTAEMPPAASVNQTLPPKIALDVQTISLADRSGSQSMRALFDSNHFTPTISEAITQWAGDRLQAVGQAGQAIILIKDASMMAVPLPMERGFNSWFKRQQAIKYVAHAAVTLEATNPNGFATTAAEASRSVTLPENASAIEQQDAYYSLLNGLMRDLGQNLEGGVHAHMSNFVAAVSFGSKAVPENTVISTMAPESLVAQGVGSPVQSAAVEAAPSPSPSTVAQPLQAPVFGTQSYPLTTQGATIPLSGPLGQ